LCDEILAEAEENLEDARTKEIVAFTVPIDIGDQ
jgi:hypothetical protein